MTPTREARSSHHAPFIKICGMTSPGAVDAAIACDVDAIGFVFAESVRRVDTARANELARAARRRVACVAVMRHPTPGEVDEVLREFRPDILQMDFDDLIELSLPRELSVLPVLRPGPRPACDLPPRLLFEGPVSGSGRTTDWDAAADLARHAQLILAGGLTPQNVAAAIHHVRPFGVDTSSGVEEAPGVKNTGLIEAFVAAARMAALELNA
jgi:phosphoribosylanthranilate isomerase